MKKRVLALLLATSMVIMAGCGNTNTPSKESEESKTSEVVSSEESKTSEVVEESKYPEYLNMDGYVPLVKEGEKVSLTAFAQRSGSVETDVNDTWFAKYVNEYLNIDLEMESPKGDAYTERRNLMFVSDELTDLLFCQLSNAEVVSYGVEGGQLLPLNEYISEELTPNIVTLFEKYPGLEEVITASDGNIYALPQISAPQPGTGSTGAAAMCIFIDDTYLEAIGRTEYPTTLDDFVEMLREFKALNPEDYGVKEIWPLVSNLGYDKMFINQAFGWMSTGTGEDPASVMLDVGTGEIVIPVTQQEKFTEYVTLMNTLYEEELIHPDYYTMDQQAARALIAGKNAAVFGDSNTTSARPDDPVENFTFQGPVSTKWNENAGVKAGVDISTGKAAISADTEYPELCMRLLDYCFSPEGSALSFFGPMAGSEETMGITEGVTVNDQGGEVYGDVVSGKAPSAWNHVINNVRWAFAWGYDLDAAYKYLWDYHKTGRTEYQSTLSTLGQEKYEECQGHLVTPPAALYLDADTTAKITDLRTVINDYAKAEVAKFVVGERPLSELPDFYKEIDAMQLDEYVKTIEECYKNYKWDGKFN